MISRETWRFVPGEATAKAGPNSITLDRGFESGRIYDVVYLARDPRVIGVGLAGTRDLISFGKHASAAQGNPSPGLRFAIGWGVSQTGRFLRHFVYEGFNADEQGRIVFDGVFDQVGGALRVILQTHRWDKEFSHRLHVWLAVGFFQAGDE